MFSYSKKLNSCFFLAKKHKNLIRDSNLFILVWFYTFIWFWVLVIVDKNISISYVGFIFYILYLVLSFLYALCVRALLGACHFIFDIIALPIILFFFISCWSHSIVSTFHSPIYNPRLYRLYLRLHPPYLSLLLLLLSAVCSSLSASSPSSSFIVVFVPAKKCVR